jgi:Mg2+ and Co2+ transporter CorA
MIEEDFRQRTQKVIDELAACIERLEKKASEVADDAKEEFSDQLEKLKELRDSLSSKLEEYEKIAEPKSRQQERI